MKNKINISTCHQRPLLPTSLTILVLGYITSVPVVLWVSVWLHGHFQGIPRISNYWLSELLTVFYFVPALMIAYRIYWYLIRFRPLNTLFTYTTLTRYFRRYHDPETKLKHMRLPAKGKLKQKPESE